MKKIIIFLAISAIISCTNQVFGWGTTGHRVIAEIAERNLKCKAKRNVKNLLDNQHMAYWANWADFIKSDSTGKWDHTHIWHFVNTPADMSKNDFLVFVQNIEQPNIFKAINELKVIVKDKKRSKEERKEALVFLIHLIGDMHQPMHTGREDDLGGNKVKVQWFGQKTNLHALWDSKLVDNEKYSYTEYATILNVLTKNERKNLQAGDLEDWLYDSHILSNYIYSNIKPDEDLSYNYNYKMRPIVDGQLQKAGLRLAKLLNELF